MSYFVESPTIVVFLMIRLGLWVLERKIMEVKVIPIRIDQGYYMLST